MNNTAWQSARRRAGLDGLHVHDLRHTFATRLATAEVPESTVSELLWHAKKSVSRTYITSHVRGLQRTVELIAAPCDDSEHMSIEALRAARSAAAAGLTFRKTHPRTGNAAISPQKVPNTKKNGSALVELTRCSRTMFWCGWQDSNPRPLGS
jgi:hypothetical protein